MNYKTLPQDIINGVINGFNYKDNKFIFELTEVHNCDPIISIVDEDGWSSNGMNLGKVTKSGFQFYTYTLFGKKVINKILFSEIELFK